MGNNLPAMIPLVDTINTENIYAGNSSAIATLLHLSLLRKYENHLLENIFIPYKIFFHLLITNHIG